MFNRIKLFIPLIIFLLLAGVFLSLEDRMISGEYDPSALPSALVGKPLPDFELSLLSDPAINKVSNDLHGKPALLNVWATWCVACRAEHAYLNLLSTRGVTIYGLNYKDDRAEANKWLQRLGNPYTFNLFDDTGQLGLNLGVYGAPETYVLDENGIIRYRHVGVLDEKTWQRKIVPLNLNWSNEGLVK